MSTTNKTFQQNVSLDEQSKAGEDTTFAGCSCIKEKVDETTTTPNKNDSIEQSSFLDDDNDEKNILHQVVETTTTTTTTTANPKKPNPYPTERVTPFIHQPKLNQFYKPKPSTFKPISTSTRSSNAKANALAPPIHTKQSPLNKTLPLDKNAVPFESSVTPKHVHFSHSTPIPSLISAYIPTLSPKPSTLIPTSMPPVATRPILSKPLGSIAPTGPHPSVPTAPAGHTSSMPFPSMPFITLPTPTSTPGLSSIPVGAPMFHAPTMPPTMGIFPMYPVYLLER